MIGMRETRCYTETAGAFDRADERIIRGSGSVQ
jgi:hypothetical protein